MANYSEREGTTFGRYVRTDGQGLNLVPPLLQWGHKKEPTEP